MRVLEEMSRARNNLNVEQPDTNFDGLYMEELELAFMGSILRNQVGTLRNQGLVFKNHMVSSLALKMFADKPEKPQIESEEHQPLVLVQPPTLPCTFGTPYKVVEVRECSEIFYTTDTFVLDDPDATDSFVLEVSNELLNLKEGMHASLPKYIDAPFVVDIAKGDSIT
ncbi:hypothetical protein Syun_003805 [Stephania yunnanensis]|uniref:Uncharacterized protein n=1 Tax=Stephania yunnanensis TaxID=152371 RepID=A0AAP0L3A0_9MAGN